MIYLIIDETGDARLRSAKPSQEDLAAFDQQAVTHIFRLSHGSPGDGNPTVELLDNLTSDELTEDEQEDKDHYEGTEYHSLEWKEVPFGS